MIQGKDTIIAVKRQ